MRRSCGRACWRGLREGAALALISDAGTPLVSDPGFKLVAEALAAGIAVASVPGPSAVLAALVIAGLPTDRFFFEGFLPPKSAARRARLNELALVPGTLVFFESPRRLAEMLADLAAELGDRPAAVARELTKLYETTRRGTLGELAAQFGAERAAEGRDRGAGRPARTPRRRSARNNSTGCCEARWRTSRSRTPRRRSPRKPARRAARSTRER